MRSVPLLALTLLSACERPVAEVDLIMPVLPIEQVIAEQVAELVAAESGLRINLIPPPDGSNSVLDALESGYGDIAFAPNNERHRDAITTIMPLYPSVLHIAAHKERPANTFDELLSGATVFAGPPDSIPRLVGEQLVDDMGFEPGTVTFVDDANTLVDVIILYVPIDRDRIRRDSRLTDWKLFSFGRPEDIGRGSTVDRAVLLNPRLRPFIIPQGTYGELTPEPVVTLAVDNLLVARADLEDTLAYDIFAEILRLRPALFSERPGLFQPLDEQISNSNWTFSLHPGALNFVQRDEPTLIERYSGVAEVLVTLLVGLVSGTFAVVRIYRIRRKNRIDKFYVEVIKLRDTVTSQSGEDARKAAIAAIKALKNRGFQLLVDEQLAADESFRIFIELTHDAIAEIEALSTDTSPA